MNFVDTANVYSDGTSEEIVGRALADYAHRDEAAHLDDAVAAAGLTLTGDETSALEEPYAPHRVAGFA